MYPSACMATFNCPRVAHRLFSGTNLYCVTYYDLLLPTYLPTYIPTLSPQSFISVLAMKQSAERLPILVISGQIVGNAIEISSVAVQSFIGTGFPAPTFTHTSLLMSLMWALWYSAAEDQLEPLVELFIKMFEKLLPSMRLVRRTTSDGATLVPSCRSKTCRITRPSSRPSRRLFKNPLITQPTHAGAGRRCQPHSRMR